MCGGQCIRGTCMSNGNCACWSGWTGRFCNGTFSFSLSFLFSLSLFISLCRFLSIFSEDIDECAEGIADCDPLVNCTNLPGTYKCGDCPPGYRTLDYGRRCEGLKSIASSTSTH